MALAGSDYHERPLTPVFAAALTAGAAVVICALLLAPRALSSSCLRIPLSCADPAPAADTG